jgi:hypothetical protein
VVSFQALISGDLSVTSLTLSTDYLNQLGGQQSVTIQAIRDGVVVGTNIVTLTNGASTVPVTLGAEFSGIDAVRIDAAPDAFRNDAPVKIDNIVSDYCSAPPHLHC